MSLAKETESKIPEETVRVARAAFPKGNPYLTLRDELDTIYTDELFRPLFAPTGQPAESPWRLAVVTLLQFAEDLSDRQAADAVRSRIDWKYLLGFALDDPGFHYSVLSEFRDRLVAGQLEQRLLDALLERFRQRGLLKARSKQRTDATHIQAAVRNLNRLELVGETLRLALDRLAVSAPEWLRQWAPLSWYERYATRFEQSRLPKTEAERERLAVQIGEDGRQLLLWSEAPGSPAPVREHPALAVLRQVWIQQFYQENESVYWRAGENLPPSGQGIASPYDAEARFSIKRETEWLGYKAHFSEICEADQPHWITHVLTTPATVPDSQVLPVIHAALADKNLLPGQHLVDMGYVDTSVLRDSQSDYGVEVLGPIQEDTSWQAQSEDGLDSTRFVIDWERQVVQCPQGHFSQHWKEATDKTGAARIYVTFQPADCQSCPLRAQCTHATGHPRSLSFKPRLDYELLQWARQRQRQPDFKSSYQKRAGIEGSLSQAVRAFDLRRSRYLGQPKTHLQHILIASAINLIRFVNWIRQVPLAATRTNAFAQLAGLAV